jgi:hypothetical protein
MMVEHMLLVLLHALKFYTGFALEASVFEGLLLEVVALNFLELIVDVLRHALVDIDGGGEIILLSSDCSLYCELDTDGMVSSLNYAVRVLEDHIGESFELLVDGLLLGRDRTAHFFLTLNIRLVLIDLLIFILFSLGLYRLLYFSNSLVHDV